MVFPRERFQRVGASLEEIEEMEAEFDASSPLVKQSLLDRLSPLPDADVRELLDQRRARAQEPAGEAEIDSSDSSDASDASDDSAQAGEQAGEGEPGSGGRFELSDGSSLG